MQIEHNQMLDMRRTWEEIVAHVVANAVFFGQAGHIASLCDGVAAKVDNTLWRCLEQLSDNIVV
jgi:hypothetical protein